MAKTVKESLMTLGVTLAVAGGVYGVFWGLSSFGADQADAEAALRAQGFSEAKATPSLKAGFFRCGTGEQFNSYDFTAKNPKGETVSGYVCQGISKGSTIRF